MSAGLLKYGSILEQGISQFPGLYFMIYFRFHSYNTIKESPVRQISIGKKTQMAFR